MKELGIPTMKLSTLQTILSDLPADLPVVYFTHDTAIGAGYHLTELKSAPVTSIDCGGNINHFHEATMQLLDGQDGQHMRAGKLMGILKHSLKALPDLDWADVRVEFSPRNEGMQLFSLGEPIVTDFELRLPLISEGAVCKPALAVGGTCGPSTCKTQSSCC